MTKDMTTMKIQNMKFHLLRSLMVVVMLVCGVGSAAGQFTSLGNYYIKNNRDKSYYLTISSDIYGTDMPYLKTQKTSDVWELLQDNSGNYALRHVSDGKYVITHAKSQTANCVHLETLYDPQQASTFIISDITGGVTGIRTTVFDNDNNYLNPYNGNGGNIGFYSYDAGSKWVFEKVTASNTTTGYVIYDGTHYLANNNGVIADVTEFNPGTCIWIYSNDQLTNNGKKLAYTTSGVNPKDLTINSDGSNWTINGNTLYNSEWWRSGDYYVHYKNGWAISKNQKDNVIYPVTITNVAAQNSLTIDLKPDKTELTWPGGAGWQQVDIHVQGSGQNYRADYVLYNFKNESHYWYWKSDHTSVPPTIEGFHSTQSSWVFEDEGKSYVTLGDGASQYYASVKYMAEPASDVNVRVKLQLKYNGEVALEPYVDITLHPGSSTNKVATPVLTFDHDAKTVSIICSTDGATVYYTTDGTNPTSQSDVYDNSPISISKASAVKAIGAKSGMTNSATGVVDIYSITDGSSNGEVSLSYNLATKNREITLTATPNTGYVFNNISGNWIVTNEETKNTVSVTIGEDNTCSFTMPASNVTVQAIFDVKQNEITLLADPEDGGTVSVKDDNDNEITDLSNIKYGQILELRAVPNAGYEFSKWDDDDEADPIPNPRTITVYGDATYTAVFTTLEYRISTVQTAGGQISGVPTSAHYKDVVSLASVVKTPDAGYKFDKWKVMCGEEEITVANDQFTMPAGDVTVSAVFAELQKDPTSLSVTETMVLNVGDIQTIIPNIEPSGNTYKEVHYSSANSNIATVSAEGAVTGVAAGQTTITVTAYKQDGSTNADLTKTVSVTVKDKVATPTIEITPNADGISGTATITCVTTGVAFYYAINSDPTIDADHLYNESSKPVVQNLQEIRVIAVKTGADAAYYSNSDIATAVYTAQKVPTPEIVIRGNEVSFDCDEPGVTFRYTTDGSTPTATSGTVWNGSVITNISVGSTIKVIATKTGFSPSEVAEATMRKANVVYLRLAGAQGNRSGSSAANAVGTWADAFAKLGYGPNAKYLRKQWSDHGLTALSNHSAFNGLTDADFTSTVDNNIIYLVGDVTEAQFSTLMGRTKSDPTSESNLMNQTNSSIIGSGFFKPVTISGKYANSSSNTEKYAQIRINAGTKYTLNEDMRFEYVEFHGDNGTNSTDFMLAYYDLEMGEGIIMTNFLSTKDFSTYHHGYAQGVTNTAHILMYGGLTCDKRFGTDPNGALNFDYYLPHPDGYKITIRSGYFSTISPGGTQWSNTTSLNGTMGSPNTPIKCTITIDIDRAWNTAHQSEVLGKTANGNPDCDVAVVIAGTHEGTMYGDVDINIKSGRIDRVVNGTFGANNFVSNHPADSYFGRASILVDPREPSTAEKTYVADKNSMVVIRELYGGGLGRFKSDSDRGNQSSTYFYGQSSVIINGGTFSSAIYASGAGGVNGVGDDDNHTPDTKLPYWNGNNIAYGTYAQFKSGRATKPFVVKCKNADGNTEEVDLYNTSAKIEIHGGVFGTASVPASIYGGGYGFVDVELIDYDNSYWKSNSGAAKPNTRAGAIFAPAGQQASSITIDGDAVIYGNVYGAGRGDKRYKNAKITYNSDDYTKLGHVYGNVALSIGGNAQIHGNVYGAGEGIDEANFGDMARLYGSTSIIIKDNANITGSVYGGGANGATDGTATVNIEGGTVSGDVYGGGALANTGNATLNLTGGTISGNAYGGGLGRTTGRAVAATVGTSTVNVGSSTAAGATVINGSVFGCNNLNGYPTGAATVNVYKTAARASAAYHLEAVYGGGNQAAYTGNPTVNVYNHSVNYIYGGGLGSTAVVTGSPVVNIEGGSLGYVFGGGSQANTTGDPTVNIKGGTVVNDVYGGGALANTGNTTVNLLAGTVNNVYGGGLGSTSVAAKVGSTTVNIGTGTVTGGLASDISGTCVITGDVFGCNNFNGTPTGEATVNVFKTNARPGAATGAYHVNQVFGGGNMASYDPEPENGTSCTLATHVNVYGCDNSIAYVYGGGNAASAPATNVYIRGGYFDYIFGGGNGRGTDNPGANVGYYTDTDINDITSHGDAYGSGEANTKIYGGIINHLFGGSNTRGNIRFAAVSKLEDEGCEFQIGEAYSAGNEAYMDGAARMEIGCIPGLAVLYGGAKAANINSDVTLTITSGTYGKVFGGNNDGGCINGKITLNIEETGCNPIIIGEVYGGGNQAAYPGTLPSNYTAKESGITVNAKSFTKIGAIFGGGYGAQATVTGNPTVNVNVVKGIWAGKNHTSYGQVPDQIGTVGEIFGGGNAATVKGNTTVNIGVIQGTGADIRKGFSVTIPKEINGTSADQVYPLEENRPTYDGNVYGGGKSAAVTGKTNVVIGPESN